MGVTRQAHPQANTSKHTRLSQALYGSLQGKRVGQKFVLYTDEPLQLPVRQNK